MSKLNNQIFTIVVRRGTKTNSNLPATYSSTGELGYTTDAKTLLVSDGTIFNPIQTLNLAVVNLGEIVTHNDEIIFNY